MEEKIDGTQIDQGEQAAGVDTQTNVGPESINSGFTLGARAEQDMTISSSLVFGAAAGRDMSAANGLTFSAAVGRDLALTDGASFVTVVGNGVNITDGASVITLCRQVTAQNGAFGIVVAREAHVAEGSKVMVNMSMKQAVALGVAFGSACALLSRLLWRK
jgi:hypothetical protein